MVWLYPHQSIETTLSKATDDLFSPQSNGHIPVLILLDLSGALDTGDNPLLLRMFHDLVLLLTLLSQSLSFPIYKRISSTYLIRVAVRIKLVKARKPLRIVPGNIVNTSLMLIGPN